MGTHTRRAFLNSCLKTPIDPCNNCPAPIYNRPKIYLGPPSRTKPPSKVTDIVENSADLDSRLWSNSGIRSLARLYDSIPDYCDINHLPEDEFYSTMDSLRSTCRELKTIPSVEESSNTSTRSHSTVCKTQKSTKKKIVSIKKNAGKKTPKTDKKVKKENADFHDASSTSCNRLLEVPQLKRTSCRPEFQVEVEAFKKTIRDYEEELRCRAASRFLGRAKSSSSLATFDSSKSKVDEITQTESDFPSNPATPNLLEASLRKSFSSNDINSITEMAEDSLKSEKTICQKPAEELTKTERLLFKDKKIFENYFAKEKTKALSPTSTELPKITVLSPSSEVISPNPSFDRSPSFLKTKKRNKNKIKENLNLPFRVFELGNNLEKKDYTETPSPVHPVARPNLAAKLRAEVSKKKLRELHNNCTYYDGTTQFDWEVRKTPAWRLLSLNETHEEILALRLATRKAEQALQQREYELNLELMRQRVKSAPLLLEGTTFWASPSGRKTHRCQNATHNCDNLKRKQRQKANNSNQSHCGSVNKIIELQKIYGSGGRTSSQSRNSQRSTSTQRRKVKQIQRPLPNGNLMPLPMPSGNDSGDELSSLDRVLL